MTNLPENYHKSHPKDHQLPNSPIITHQTLSSSYAYHNKIADYLVQDLCIIASWEHLCAVSSHLDQDN